VLVAGATVRIAQLDITTTTDADGNFGFANIPVGPYTLQVSAPGHGEANIPFSVMDPTTPTVLNVVLNPMP